LETLLETLGLHEAAVAAGFEAVPRFLRLLASLEEVRVDAERYRGIAVPKLLREIDRIDASSDVG
jgi:hypothetical protein